MATNWEDFTPVADAPDAVNWEAFQPVAEPATVEAEPAARAQRQADLRAQLAAERAKPEPGRVQGFISNEKQALANVATGAAQIVPSTLRAIGTGGAFISRQTGIPGPTVPEETGTFKAGEVIQRQLDRLPTGAGQGEDFLLQDVPQAIGQMGSMLATGGTAKALGAGAKMAGVIASTSGFGQEFDDAMQTATARGQSPDEAFARSLGYASVATLIENLGGAGRVFRKYFPNPEAAAQVLTKFGVSKAIAGNFIAGYAEEASQRIAQNVIVSEAATAEQLLEGAHREGLAGSLVQGMVTLPSVGRVPTRASDVMGTEVPPASRQADPVPPQRTTPATAGQPLAVFRGANGQEIFVTLGDATVEQVQEMMFRTQPGAEFIRTEGGATSDTANVTPTKNVLPAADLSTAPAEQSSDIEYSPMDYAGGEVNWEDFTPVEETASAPAAEELPAPLKAKPKAAAEPAPAAAASPSGITEGQTVFARLSLKSNKLHKAQVVRVTEDGITVRYAKSKKFQTLPHGQVQLPANVEGRKLYESQFDDLDPEAKKTAKTSARAFDDAIRNEGWRFQWYDPQHETNTETAGQRAASQAAFKRGRAAAFQALGLTTDPESALDRAAALPALQAFLKERRGDVEQQQDFDAATADGPVPVQADELAVGMVLDIDGEETKVVDVSPEGVVTLQDGTKFGRQTLESGETIYVEAVQGEAGSVEFAPEEPTAPALTLDAPESVEQQRAREEAEAAKRAEQAAKDKLKERAAKSLVGSTGDLGQGDLLGAPTDLFAPPAPKPAKPFGSENTLISSSKAEELRKRLREKLGGRTSTGVVPSAAQMTTPEAVAETLLDDHATPAQQQAAEQKADQAGQRVRGMRVNPKNQGEAGFTNLPQILADLLVAGARVLKRGGQWTMTRAQWSASMLKQFGQGISRWLANTWSRLQRVQNQQTAGAVAIGHVNAIEELAGNTNIADEQKPLYTPAQLAAGRPSLLTKAAPTSTQIKLLGGQALLDAKRRRDVEEATQAAAVKAQSDELWKQLVASAAWSNPLATWHLPQWLIGTTRARKFKERALHIAARLNATARDANGNFVFTDFRQRMGGMSVRQFAKSELAVGDQIQMANPVTGAMELVTVGPLITTPDGRVFHQLYRDIDAATQAALYQHYAAEYPDMIWFLDMFIDPVLANTRQTINGIEIPVFNRFAAAAMMADGNPNFSPLAAYTPDVLVTRSLIGSIRGALSFRSGTRSPGRKYKSGTSREGGHVRDLLSGFNIRTWQMLAEQSRKGWMRAVLAAATPIQKGQVPAGWVKLETGMEELWLAVKRLRNWSSPNEYKDITKQVQDDGLEEIEATLKEGQSIVQKDGRWFIATKLFPETEARMSQRGQLDEDRDYSAFFGEAASLRGRQLMLPEQLVKQLIGKYVAHVEHGALYRLGAWAVRNSTRLLLAAPTTYVANILTNDLFTLEAASRRILSGVAGANVQDLRFARELAIGEFYKFFPGLRSLVDGRFRNTVQEILPENIFADQTALADLKMRLDEDPISYLRQGEIGAAALQLIRYGDIDVKAKTRMAYAWLKAQAVTNARKAGLRGGALRVAVDVYLENPPMADRARAVEIAGFELLNYADTPDWLQNLASNDYSKLLLPFPRFGYHYIAKNAQRAAALRDVLSKVPKQKRADAFADFVTFLLWPAGGLGVLAALGLKGLGGDDDDEARKLVGTSRIKTLDEAGEVVSKPIDRAVITSNRINLSGWARQLGLGTDNENDFWLRVRNYPVVAMAGAALLAEDDAREFGPKEGAKTYLNMVGDLAGDFFSLGMAARVPAKAYQELFGRPGDRTAVDAYSAGVPFVAYVTDQTLDSFLPGTRQADLTIRWLDPVARRRTVSKTEGYTPTVWDAARVGHLPGLLDRLLTGGPGEHGAFESTLPPETSRRSPEPQVISAQQRMAELAGFNIKPINRAAYESAIAK